MSSSAVFQRVVAAQPLANEDQEFWWKATAPPLADLLHKSGYSPAQLEFHLTWYRRFIPASLGPRPVPGKKLAYLAGPPWDGSPMEPSINWKEKSRSGRLIRFTIGPSSDRAGTDADPFGQAEPDRLLRSMADFIPGLSLKNYEVLVENLFIKKQDQAALLARIPAYTPRVQAWLAWDCRPAGPMAKVYFLPYLKMLETGRHSNDFLADIVEQCSSKEDIYGSYEESYGIFRDYLDSFADTPRLLPQTQFFGIDCTNGPESRIKTYASTRANTLREAKKLWTLGGRAIGPDTDDGLQALTEMWPIFFGLDSLEGMDDRVVFPDGYGVLACIELKPGPGVPEVKLHWPLDVFNLTDSEISARLSAWFRHRGHGEFADKYSSDLEESL